MEAYELDIKALRKAKFDIMYKYYKDQINQGEYPEMEKYLNRAEKPFIFLTVNPKPSVNLLELKKAVEKCHTKKWIAEFAYAYEQRGIIPGEYPGIHVHSIIKYREKKLSEIKREIQNTFKNLIGNAKHCDIKVLITKFLPDKEKYIQGLKGDEEKFAKSLNDINMRKDYGLDRIYSNYNYTKHLLKKNKSLSIDATKKESCETETEKEESI